MAKSSYTAINSQGIEMFKCKCCSFANIPLNNGQTVCDECKSHYNSPVSTSQHTENLNFNYTATTASELAKQIKAIKEKKPIIFDSIFDYSKLTTFDTPPKPKPKKKACKNPKGCPWLLDATIGTKGDSVKPQWCKKCYDYAMKHGNWPFGGEVKKKKKRGPTFEQKVWERIGLHPKLNLKMECADFYILEKIVAESGWTDSRQFMGNEKILMMLREREEFLANEFAIYLDMVLGGEVRHAWQTGGGKGFLGSRDFSPAMKAYLEKVGNLERHEAWDIWTRMRRRAPKKTLPLLQEVVHIFEQEWKGGAGGENWAKIGRVALPYIEGRMSPRSFVNLCWSLQHCNNFVFDKTYDVDGLNRVLEVQANKEYDAPLGLLQYASPEVQVQWKRFKMEQHKPAGMDVPWWHGSGD